MKYNSDKKFQIKIAKIDLKNLHLQEQNQVRYKVMVFNSVRLNGIRFGLILWHIIVGYLMSNPFLYI